MSLQHNDTYRLPGSTSASTLDELRAELISLVETKSPVAVEVARNYCALAHQSGDPAILASGHYLSAQALLQQSELKSALESALLSAELFASFEDGVGQAKSETLAGKINLGLGESERAEEYLRTALLRVSGVDTPETLSVRATALNHLGAVLFNRGDIEEAILSLESALATWKHLQDPSGQINCLTNIGSIQSTMGQFDAAISNLNQAYSINCADLKDSRSESFILISLSRAHALNRDFDLAIDVAKSALASARLSNDYILTATALLNIGSFYLETEDFKQASCFLKDGVGISRTVGFRSGEMSGADSMGVLHTKLGEVEQAKLYFTSALAIALELEETQGELESRLHLAGVELSLGNVAEALVQVTRSLELAVESESPKEAAEAHRILAELEARQGEYRRAFEHSQEHLRIKDELFNTERDRQTRNLSIQFEVERARNDANVYRVRTEVEQEARLAAEVLVQERTAELAQAHQEVVTRLAMAAEYRDDTTGEHTRRVGRTAARIARALGWPEHQARILGIAARLHDVGKIGIPDSILLKAGKLSAEEYGQMKSHTLIGSRILSGGRSDLLRMAEEIALTHHERWDGGGYPRGLGGEQVPLTGRIVALADVFDALTQDRPYKRAWTAQEALSEIQGLSGSHFDPRIVEVALRVLSPGGEALTDDGTLDDEDASHLLSVFEQLQVERTRDVEEARLSAEHAARELERLAVTDALTALPNRRAFEADLEMALHPPGSNGGMPGGVSVVSVDLDGLKGMNDTLGSARGDVLLRQFGDALERAFAPGGRVYRIGGDEFAVILLDVQDDSAVAAVVEQVIRAVQVEGLLPVGASVGVARAPDDARTAGDLLRESDRRMYADKLRRRVRTEDTLRTGHLNGIPSSPPEP